MKPDMDQIAVRYTAFEDIVDRGLAFAAGDIDAGIHDKHDLGQAKLGSSAANWQPCYT